MNRHIIACHLLKVANKLQYVVIKLQQDNSPDHIKPDDTAFFDTYHTTGLYIQLVFQSHNIPGLNVLDLIFFNSIQSLQYTNTPRSTYQLIISVQESF